MANHFVAFWNLENLFAPEGYPDRELWIAKELAGDLKGWSQELFISKINQLSSIIGQMNNSQGPDILGVCEVENKFALQKLSAHLNEQIPSRDYDIVHADSTRDQRGIDTAFIFDRLKYTVAPDTLFSYFVMRRTGTRDITQITFTTQRGNDLIAMCNHWPSRSGDAYKSRGYRMIAGETLSYWHQRILEKKGKDIPIIAMGDFNDNPFDESLQIHACATRERGDVERAKTAAYFYNLAWRYLVQVANDHKGKSRQIHGTYYYDGDGNVFDQLLVSKGLLSQKGKIRVIEDTAKIELFPEMVDHSVANGPIPFGLSKGDVTRNVNTNGFSDHFPVSVVLEE
jgi:predicted extracellular nuclease